MCNFAACDDCIDEKGYDKVYSDICFEENCNFQITCSDPNHDLDNYCNICIKKVFFDKGF